MDRTFLGTPIREPRTLADFSKPSTPAAASLLSASAICRFTVLMVSLEVVRAQGQRNHQIVKRLAHGFTSNSNLVHAQFIGGSKPCGILIASGVGNARLHRDSRLNARSARWLFLSVQLLRLHRLSGQTSSMYLRLGALAVFTRLASHVRTMKKPSMSIVSISFMRQPALSSSL